MYTSGYLTKTFKQNHGICVCVCMHVRDHLTFTQMGTKITKHCVFVWLGPIFCFKHIYFST